MEAIKPESELERIAQAIASCMPCPKCPRPCSLYEMASTASCVRHWMETMKNACDEQRNI